MKAFPVKKKDLPSIIEMLQSISSFYPKSNEIEDIWESYLSQDHVFGFSFFINNEIVGYGVIIFETKIRGGKMAHLEDIVVKQFYRGKGVGKKIIEFLVDYARKKNCYKISLSCKSNNVIFYEKNGFFTDGITMKNILII
jgi:GNAT superfamily N-acetyltransferase